MCKTNERISAVLMGNHGRFTSVSFVTKRGKLRRMTCQHFSPYTKTDRPGYHYICGRDTSDGVYKNINLDTILEVRSSGLVHTFRRVNAKTNTRIDRSEIHS